ncbi:hypothetical protein BTE56_03050 [Agrobacterium pusense]|jgi:DNA-binding MarR family transcriptional regulator|nr:hypothetical protein BA939_22545 [Rhizobium sp. S41]OAI84525.1 hypothetical protein AYO27_15050 [Rhizobium sp. GHKF11]OOO24389.1 hypothetical protein BTE56_03050 [Agrobacterium pusense]
MARMERDDLIKREPDPRDKRSSLVSLTQAALARLPAGRAFCARAIRDMTKGLSREEVDTLVSLLRRVLDNVEALEA